MNKLEQAFSSGKAFIPFITAGDPSLEITEQLVLKMAEAGADLIELGIPFSDPVAEGPVIQEADYRALSGGVTTDKIFDMVERVRKSCNVPIAFMTYANPIFSYGTEKFLRKCSDTGIDAVIVPDIPFEEKEELAPFCKEYDVKLISMIAPTSKERVRMIVEEAEGFVYCVSSMGVTGVRDEIGNDAKEMIKQVKAVKDIPCAIGFGISNPEQAAEMARFSDGVIVGSAIVKIIAQYGVECIPHVEAYVREMKSAIK
ncbi:tryptophan synthase subunit alpha [Acetivibrio mesophilus]|uniref:Tryptophan synthase alpha chain n=1 Tax=Acetivibrio mesophilus TaxID=2487273 RepID=A0A4Q0I8M3_9FIRM|nr:tryptophan synthase subunit alpha [Acetivibrio mesophilus]ODM26195.1 tryptophan synthase subunit alpha [Clostridium sp. Bc-iso-3]RXE60753.1 tryptophan synthase subunit alpha [Acetivibrio mesophilus]HHV28168.1 tryptophan synthase subunit alpha [Clostridium sp.]